MRSQGWLRKEENSWVREGVRGLGERLTVKMWTVTGSPSAVCWFMALMVRKMPFSISWVSVEVFAAVLILRYLK